MIKLVIFDMDGTICDTIEDLANATNCAMRTLGHPEHTVDEYKYLVGNGIPNLIFRALPENCRSEAEVEEAKTIMLDYYKEHYVDRSRPYDGIIDLLEYLKNNGIHIAVCTNKAHHMAVRIADKLFSDLFDTVIGQSDGHPLKPSPSSPCKIMEKYGVLPENTLFVGDSGVDMQTAVNSKTHSVGVLWGFRTEDELKENGAEHIARTPDEIKDIIKKL